MNIEIDKAKQDLLDAIGSHHRSVVMLLGNSLNSTQLDATEGSIVSAMRAGVDRVASTAKERGIELGKQDGLAESRKLTKEERATERRNGYNEGYCAAMHACLNSGTSDRNVDEAFEQGKLAVTRMCQELFGVKLNFSATLKKPGLSSEAAIRIAQDLSEGNLFSAKPFSEFIGASYGLYADEDMAALEKEREQKREQKRRFRWNSFPLFGVGKDVRFRIGANGSESAVVFHSGVEVGDVLPSGTLCPTCWIGEARANKARVEAKRIAEFDAKSHDSVVSRMMPPKMMPNPELFETVFNGKVVTLQNMATRGVMIVADGWVIGSVCYSTSTTITRFVGSAEEIVGAGCVVFLTGKILAFSSWQFRYPNTTPFFKSGMCAVEGKRWYAVAVERDGGFRLIGPDGNSVCSIGKSSSGLAFAPVVPGPPEHAVIEAALKTIRREFYGNMG